MLRDIDRQGLIESRNRGPSNGRASSLATGFHPVRVRRRQPGVGHFGGRPSSPEAAVAGSEGSAGGGMP